MRWARKRPGRSGDRRKKSDLREGREGIRHGRYTGDGDKVRVSTDSRERLGQGRVLAPRGTWAKWTNDDE